MDTMNNFKIYLSFCLFECVMVGVSVEHHSQISHFYYMDRILLYWEIYKNIIWEAIIKFGPTSLSAEFRYWNILTFQHISYSISGVHIFFNAITTNSQKRFKNFFDSFIEFDLKFCFSEQKIILVSAKVLELFLVFVAP